MNTAVRTLTQSLVTPKWLAKSMVARSQWLVLSLLSVVVFSALAVIITSNQSRLTTLNLQQAQAHEQQLQTEYGQLLLEQATYSTGAHVQQVAQQNLDMVVPSKVHMVNE